MLGTAVTAATATTCESGTFYEGAIVSGYPSDATDNAIQANVGSQPIWQ